mmetsp:Transcript_22522/g.45713  ORF Transcript_22522/g.45713 Transcript_22522/m.45713 type:complete len:189 (-) Transcript_22522:13-579(-)
MQKARPLVSFQLFLLCITGAGAFSPVAKSNNVRISPSALYSERPSEGHVNMQRRSDFLALLGTAVTGSIVSSVEPAYATVPFNPSSSMYLSDSEVKTFDLSMPSYDSINTLKADEKALGIEGAPEPVVKGTKQKVKAKKESSSNDSILSSVLPSMNKSGPKPKAAKKEKAPKPEKAAPSKNAEVETMD